MSQGLAKQDSGLLPKTLVADSPTTELAELFLNIHSAISHLFELSMLVGQDRPRGRIGSHKQSQSATNNRPDIVNATDKFPTLHNRRWIAERLGNLVAQRREYIRYRQSHRRNLAHYSVPGQDPTESHIATKATTKATTFYELIGHDSPRDMSYVETRSFVSVATSFTTTSEGISGSGRKIPELADMWLDGDQLGYSTYIECPYVLSNYSGFQCQARLEVCTLPYSPVPLVSSLQGGTLTISPESTCTMISSCTFAPLRVVLSHRFRPHTNGFSTS